MSVATSRINDFKSRTSNQPSKAKQTYNDKKQQALSAKNTVVMSYEELERIKSMCSSTNEQQDYQSMRYDERKDLHQKSIARVSKWPNTIQAERERKEYERIKKLEDDEVSFRFEFVWGGSKFE